MTTAKACQGTEVSGWGRARVCDGVWARVRVRNDVSLTLTSPLEELGLGLTMGRGGRVPKRGLDYHQKLGLGEGEGG